MDAKTRSETSRLDRIAQLERERARTEAQITREMLAYADECRVEAEKYAEPRVRNLEAGAAADELALVLRQPTRTVQLRLAQARRARTLLPLTSLAHRRGSIDAFRVSVVSEYAAMLENAESLIALDGKVVAYAARHTVAQLRSWLRRFVARIEPNAGLRRHRRAHADRCVWFQHDADGISWLHAQMTSLDAHRINALLNSIGEKLSDNDPGLNLEQARSDALTGLLLGRISDSGSTGQPRSGATIAITVPVTSLSGLSEEPGESFDGQFALPAELVRELAAEPGTLFCRVMTDPLGHILDVTELGRFPSRKLRTAIQIRDGVCRFATCSRPAAACDLDHEIPHPRGPTSGDNLQPLCRRHHRLKTHGLLPTESGSKVEHALARTLLLYEPAA